MLGPRTRKVRHANKKTRTPKNETASRLYFHKSNNLICEITSRAEHETIKHAHLKRIKTAQPIPFFVGFIYAKVGYFLTYGNPYVKISAESSYVRRGILSPKNLGLCTTTHFVATQTPTTAS